MCHPHDPSPALAGHRQLGERLELFHLAEESPGAVFWHPKGLAVVEALAGLCRELNAEQGFGEVRTPILHDASVWERSGHAAKFSGAMFYAEADGRRLGLKPMSCPAHIAIYARRPRSHRELPLRYAEQGLVHRLEPSGSLNGLLRARQFTQDDAHVFCRRSQVEEEARAAFDLVRRVYRVLDLDVRYELSLRPDNRLGNDAEWDDAEEVLRGVLHDAGVDFEERPGEGSFYGPKIDVHALDGNGRAWQLGTVQVDYQLPERFDLSYRDEHDRAQRPAMLHRALIGSFERCLGLLLSRDGGALPLWLAPQQVVIVPRGEAHHAYAQELLQLARRAGLRAAVDARPETLGRRIRDAELERVPVVLVVGDRELAARSVAVRRRGQGDLGPQPPGRVIAALEREVRRRGAD
jgi:threonyl-tRNA synthetase